MMEFFTRVLVRTSSLLLALYTTSTIRVCESEPQIPKRSFLCRALTPCTSCYHRVFLRCGYVWVRSWSGQLDVPTQTSSSCGEGFGDLRSSSSYATYHGRYPCWLN